MRAAGMGNAATTILVPVYNGAAFLPGLVAALRAQTASPARVLFVDDRSSDGSADVIRDLGCEVVVNDRNRGLYGSIPNALNLVSTDYTALIFQDDLPKPEYLTALSGVAAARPDAAFLWAAILPHCADFDFLLRAIRAATFLYYERPLMQIRLHSAQASTGNLRTARDISERIDVMRDHLRLYSHDATLALRWRLFLDMSRAIALRCGSGIRRRQLGTTLAAARNFADAFRLLTS